MAQFLRKLDQEDCGVIDYSAVAAFLKGGSGGGRSSVPVTPDGSAETQAMVPRPSGGSPMLMRLTEELRAHPLHTGTLFHLMDERRPKGEEETMNLAEFSAGPYSTLPYS